MARYFGDRTIGFFGINLSPALLGVGYIVGFNIGCLMLSGGALSWWVFIPFYNNFMIDQNPVLAQQLVGLSAADAAGLDLEPAGPLHRRRRDADRRPLVAVVAAQVAAVRNPHRHEHEGRLGRGRAAHRAGPADEGDPDRHRALRAAAVRALLRGRRQPRHRARAWRSSWWSPASCSPRSAATWPASSAPRTTRSPASRSRPSCSPRSCCSRSWARVRRSGRWPRS